jgi:nicotinamide-nucleotide amidase
MQAILITIGDELLIGQTIDTNSAWMGQQLNALGVWVKERIAIGDQASFITETLDAKWAEADLFLLTGGLGPTKDDLTKKTLADYFGGELVVDEQVLKHVTDFFVKRGRPMLERNSEQALVPNNCRVLFNAQGTAPGMMWEKDGKMVVSMPGVPFEMKHLMETHVLPKIAALSDTQVMHRTLVTAGIGESFLAELIHDWEEALPSNIKLAYLPSLGMVKLRLTIRGKRNEELQTPLEREFEQLQSLVKAHLMCVGDYSPEQALANVLLEKNATVAFAESCTGGLIQSKMISIAGSSTYVRGGVVAYHNDLKQSMLGVKESTLIEAGAVSEACVREMCLGVMERLNSDYGISVSGVAGPTGGSAEKPVGTVWVAVGERASGEILCKCYSFRLDRMKNIELTYVSAIMQLMQFIKTK